jgi:hypothetical protein
MNIDFSKLPTGLNGGITVIDKMGDDYILLVGSSIKYRKPQYSLFGGHYEKRDLNVLHTSIREFVEELFNFKISQEKIRDIADFLSKNNRILDISMKLNDSYVFFINFKTFESIFNYLKNGSFTIKEKFQIDRFNRERIWHERNIIGLNEVEKVEGIFLEELKMINSRRFTNTLANFLDDKLKSIEAKGQ